MQIAFLSSHIFLFALIALCTTRFLLVAALPSRLPGSAMQAASAPSSLLGHAYTRTDPSQGPLLRLLEPAEGSVASTQSRASLLDRATRFQVSVRRSKENAIEREIGQVGARVARRDLEETRRINSNLLSHQELAPPASTAMALPSPPPVSGPPIAPPPSIPAAGAVPSAHHDKPKKKGEDQEHDQHKHGKGKKEVTEKKHHPETRKRPAPTTVIHE